MGSKVPCMAKPRGAIRLPSAFGSVVRWQVGVQIKGVWSRGANRNLQKEGRHGNGVVAGVRAQVNGSRSTGGAAETRNVETEQRAAEAA